VFSSRLPDELSENQITRRVRALRAEGVALLDLTLANPTRAGFSFPDEEIREAFARFVVFAYDPHPRGLLVTREAIARYYEKERRSAEAGEALNPEHLHCTASSSEAYSMLFKLLCEPGDEICIPHPAYPLFSWLAALDAVEVRPYNLRLAPEGRWRIDMHSLDMAVGERTRAIIVVNPSNPAANYLRPDEFAQLDALCARRGIALITDEVFWDFPLEQRIDTEALRRRTVGFPGEALRFTINGLSKLLALPQMKLGWLITEGPSQLRDEALTRLDVIADAYLSVSTPVMAAAPALFDLRERMQQQIRTRCVDNLAVALDLLGDAATGGRLLRPEGGWSALVALSEDTDEERAAMRLLEEQHVLVHPGSLFDFPRGKYLVLSLLTESAGFREGVGLLHE
jgi:aspartate/methionine/tyrosine aminotransferase